MDGTDSAAARQLLKLVTAVHSTLCLKELPKRYLQAVPECVTATGYGFYLLDRQKRAPSRVEAMGVSSRFLHRYEAVRMADPLFRAIQQKRRPVVPCPSR